MQNRIYDFVSTATGAGIAGAVDLLGGSGINYLMEDLAFGAGWCGGSGAREKKSGKIATSIAILMGTMYPQMQELAASGDIETFIQNAGTKLIVYGAGAATQYLIPRFNQE